jgi:DNA polymerase-3 subunit delta'
VRAFDSLCPWLRDALATLEAAAREERLGHGWLLTGPRDVGKRNLAYVLAERLLEGRVGSELPVAAEPGDIVGRYAELAEGPDLHPDLYRLRPEEDKRTIQVEQVRDLIAALALTPHLAGLKVVIIEEAESMTTGAANALLKSLEEPTADTYLLLLAERPGRLPPTIRSRCQQLALKPPTPAVAAAWLNAPGGAAEKLPAKLLSRSPLAAARAILDEGKDINYKEIYENIDKLYEGRSDPHRLAEQWHGTDADLGLSCLIDSLMARIRGRLVPERWTPVTESRAAFADNSESVLSTEALFESLATAEELREQLGRGINVELALKALLLGLEPPQTGRLNT